ncbi:MAG: hypothetical protein WBZ35_29420 [Pseudolabrys sp.]
MSTICSAPVAAQRTAREPIKPQQLMGKQSTLAVLAHIIRYWHKADMNSPRRSALAANHGKRHGCQT